MDAEYSIRVQKRMLDIVLGSKNDAEYSIRVQKWMLNIVLGHGVSNRGLAAFTRSP